MAWRDRFPGRRGVGTNSRSFLIDLKPSFNVGDAFRSRAFKKAVLPPDSRQLCRPGIADAFPTEQRVLLEQAEQFEHNHDNDDHSNYVKNISIHEAINTRSRYAWSTVVGIYGRSSKIYFERRTAEGDPSAVLGETFLN